MKSEHTIIEDLDLVEELIKDSILKYELRGISDSMFIVAAPYDIKTGSVLVTPEDKKVMIVTASHSDKEELANCARRWCREFLGSFVPISVFALTNVPLDSGDLAICLSGSNSKGSSCMKIFEVKTSVNGMMVLGKNSIELAEGETDNTWSSALVIFMGALVESIDEFVGMNKSKEEGLLKKIYRICRTKLMQLLH